jgi:DNA-binding transcriptional ArsR family regulator
MTITDPQVMRALAHPARLTIKEYLASTGEAVTATGCAEIVGLSPSATSYHLRELAR